MRPFVLIRDTDVTGISGTGQITEGIEFSDGTCAMRWTAAHRSTCVYDSVTALLAIHGHDGATRIEWHPDAHYTSTYCMHEVHAACRQTCKICYAPCLCPCHQGRAT